VQRSKKVMQVIGGVPVSLDVGMWMPPSATL
jgi:hypothetical protein